MAGMRFPHISWNSIRFKLIVGLFLITVPLIMLLIYNNYYSISVVHNQVALSNKNMISLYMGQIDTQLEDVDRSLIHMVSSDFYMQAMRDANSEDEYQLAKHIVSDQVANAMVLLKSTDAIFVYSQSRRDLLDVFKEHVSFAEKVRVEDFLKSFLQDYNHTLNKGKQWFVQKIEQNYYVFRVMRSGDLYIGSWVNAKTLLIPLQFIELGQDGSTMLVSDQAEPMVSTLPISDRNIDFTKGFEQFYMSGAKNDLLVVGQPSQKGNFSLVAVIPDKFILQRLPKFSMVITLISFASILFLPISLFFLHRILLVPLKRLLAVIRKVNLGHVNVRMESFATSNEFQLLNQSFNTMMTQIEELKINVYEEQISKQKVELQHLQLQINPHFFMNALSSLYHLAQVKNFQLIQEIILSMVKYFRYMFRSNLTLVSLQEELQHTRNYIRLQELRFPNSLTYTIDSPDVLDKVRVPPLVIQTFLENAIKHNVTLENPICLSVSIELKETELEPCIEIVIRDTGKGFAEEMLVQIHSANNDSDHEGEHIGIWNIKKRLQLLYGDKAAITCYNGFPNGAVVEIKLPYQYDG